MMTCEDIAQAFEEALEADKNGSVWAVLPDMPIIEVPDMSGDLLYPTVLYAKAIGFLRPNIRRLDAFYALYVFLFLLLLAFLFLMSVLY